MFFGGGLSGFFDDIVCGVQEATYNVTHPSIWGTDCVTSTDETDNDNSANNDTGSMGLEEFMDIASKIESKNISEEELNKIADKLSNTKISFDVNDMIDLINKQDKTLKDKEPEQEKHDTKLSKKEDQNSNSLKKEEPKQKKEKINTKQDVDEKDTVTFKDAVMSTPLGKRLFEHIDEPVAV